MEKDISPELAQLSAKVSALRRERWLWRLSLAVVAGFILIGAGPGKSVMDELRTRKVVVVDSEGKTRALLDVFPYGPELVLYDAQGDVRAWLTVTTAGPALVLYDPDGDERAALTAYSGVPELVLYDAYAQGKRGAELSLPQKEKTSTLKAGPSRRGIN
jgi:hypothetical protein